MKDIDPRVLKLLILEWWAKQQWVDEVRDDRWVEIDGSPYDMEELANWLILKLGRGSRMKIRLTLTNGQNKRDGK